MTATDTLYIHQASRLIATLSDQGLRYDPAWRQDPNTFPLSHRFPKDAPNVPHDIAWSWLVNLLPEGDARKRIAARLQISLDDDLELMRVLGSDCAGAIQISVKPIRGDQTNAPKTGRYKRLDASQLVALATRPGVCAQLLGQNIRLSLAGAQDKIPLRRCADQSLWLPLLGAPSTHLLKCPNPNFAHLVENEHFCLRLAQAVGLEVANSEIVYTTQGQTLLLVQRFDREDLPPSPGPDLTASECELPWVQRFHQEDFAQALGHAHYEKYEGHGGPRFADCVQLLKRSAQRPSHEVPRLVRWFIFCLIIGNRDNHAKNIARLYRQGYWTLAPFYDLVCTRAYRAIDRQLAMTVGTQRDISRLSSKVWADEARACGLGPKMLIQEVQDMCTKVHDALDPTYQKVREAHKLPPSSLTPVIKAIRKGLRVTEQDLY